VSPAAGNTTGTGYTFPGLTVTANPTGLAANTYNGTVSLNYGQGITGSIPVTFTVGAAKQLTANPTSLAFTHTIGTTPPTSKTVAIATSPAGATAITASVTSGNSWLSVSPPSGTTPVTLTASVNTAGLTAGVHNGNIAVTASGVTNSPLNIPVSITVTAPTLTVNTTPLNFSYTLGGATPAAQPVSVGGTSGIQFTTSTGSATWLSATPANGTVPGNINVSINTAGITAGTHNGSVVVTSSGATGSPATIPVTLTVTAPTLTVTPSSLNFSYQIGGAAPQAQPLNIGGTSGQTFSASAAGASWLSINPASGSVPGSTSVSINTAGLTPNTYNASIAVSAPGAATQNVPVTLTVTPAPTISVTPSSLNFSYQIGSAAPTPQQISIGGAAGLAYTISTGGSAWLSVSPGSGNTPGSASVTINTAGLTADTYNGTITVTAPTASNSPQTVAVTLTVTNAPVIAASPGSLTFNYQVGGSAPASQPISIGGTAGLAYTIGASGGSWLSVSPGGGTTPGNANVSINTAGLTPNTYNGTITVTAPGASNSPQTVSVTLNVSAAPTISVSPASLSFNAQVGGTSPPAQPISISATSQQPYTVSASDAWMQVSPGSGTTPGSASVSVNTAGLAPGPYNGTITVTSAGASNSPQTVAVTLNVSAAPTISVSPASLNFSAQAGGAAPAPQQISISGSSALSYSVSAGSSAWLSVSPGNGTTPGSASVSVNPAGLSVGTHNGTITVTSSGASNSPQTVSVTLNVTAAPTIAVSPSSLNFTVQAGGTAPAPQQISIGGGSALSYTVSAGGSAWLSVSPGNGTTPGNASVSVNPSGLSAGTYNGTITVTASGASNSPQTVAVALTVTPAPTLTVSPATLTFSYQVGGTAPAAQSISIGASSAVAYSVSAGSTAWLQVSPASGTTPGTASVSINATGLTPGTYNGTIAVTSAGASNSPQNVVVALTVTPAPTITVSPATLSFTFQTGGTTPSPQQLSITSGSALSYTVSASGGAWLSVSPGSGNTPGNPSVSVNPSSLSAGTYNGTITVTATGASNSPQTVAVTLTVTTAPVISVTPALLTFNYQLGGASPAAQTVNIGGTSGLSFTVAASGGAWLSVSPGSGNTPGSASVAVNPTGLSAGTYNGTITVTAAGASNSPQTVQVTLVVSSAPVLSVTPTSLNFNYQVGGSTPAPQQLSISGGSALAYTVSTGGAAWLSVIPPNGVTPGSASVVVVPAGLSAGTYDGTITVTAAGASNSPQTVTVTLSVTATASLALNPTTLNFTYQPGGSVPAPQSISIGGASGLSYTVAAGGGSWLSVSPGNGTTPGTASVSVNPVDLSVGTYSGVITVTSAGASNSPQSVTVTLSVTAGTGQGITVSPSSLSFNYQVGTAAPAPQLLSIGGASGLSFSAAAAGGAWLSASPSAGTTPSSISVAVNPAGLSAGTYSGSVTVTSGGTSSSSQTVQVILVVSAAPGLTASPSALSFTFQLNGAAPPPQTLSISGGAAVPYAASATGGTWLTVSPAGGSTPGSATVTVNPAGLSHGTYNGVITILPAGNTGAPLTVPVVLTVTVPPKLTVSRSRLTFTAVMNGQNPLLQSVDVLANPSVPFSFSVNGTSWLAVATSSLATPAELTVGINPQALGEGTYDGYITLAAAEPSYGYETVAVRLVVTANPSFLASSSSLTFSSQAGTAADPQIVALTGSSIVGFQVTAGSPWLSATPVSATLPASIAISANASGLQPGVYTSSVTISAPGSGFTPLTIPVTFTVTGNPAIASIVDAVNVRSGFFAPGSVVSIFGKGIGPSNPVTYTLDASGRLNSILAGVRVLVDGIPAVPLVVWKEQVNVILPYSTRTSGQAEVRVEYGGAASQPFPVPMAPEAFGLFTVDSTAMSSVAALNQDGSVNSESNPAEAGSIVVLFGAGGGALQPAVVEGGIAGPELSRIVASVSAEVNGAAASVHYAGTAPSLLVGVNQVNLQLPSRVAPGMASVTVRVGGSVSQTVTVFVK
jgi:uncharacterized protein (TIGR03437 family)